MFPAYPIINHTMNQNLYKFLRWSEKYTKTDMVYIAHGGFWEITKVIGVTLTTFAVMFAFARWVPQEIYGTYRYVLSIIAILAIASLPGINTSLIRAIARGKEGMLKHATITRLKWGLLTAFASIGVAGWYLLNGNTTLGMPFLYVAAFLPFAFAFETFEYFWRGRKQFDVQSKYRITVAFIASAILIAAVFFTNNLVVLVLAYFASRAVLHTFFYVLSGRAVKNEEQDNETIPFGKHLTVMGSVGMSASQLETVIIWQFLGPVAVALYSFAWLPISRIRSLIPINELALPKLGELNVSEQKKKILDKFWRLFAVVIPLTIVSVLVAPIFYRILFPAYMESVPYFQFLTITLLFIPFMLLDSSLVSDMKKKELYILQFAVPTFKIVLFLIFIPIYGIAGVVAALIATHAFRGIATFYFFKKM